MTVDMLSAQILDAIDGAADRVPTLLAEMVRARSINPWFSAAESDSREGRLQRLLRPRLEALGAEIDEWEPNGLDLARYEGRPGYHRGREYRDRPNLVGRIPGSGGGRSLLLLGHADTVSVDPGWSTDPFGAELRNGLLFGRGSVDMKGGMAAALIALEVLDEIGVTLAGDVLYASVVDEEAGGMGTLAFVDRGHRADSAVIPEPTGLTIAPLCRGVLWARVTIPGRAGHIEIPQPSWRQGGAVDAIALGRDLMSAVDELNSRWAVDPSKSHPLLPVPCQANASVISGGSVPSSWAPSLAISFDIQYLPAERDEYGLGSKVRAEFESAVRDWAQTYPWLVESPPSIEWMVDADCAEIASDHPLVGALQEACATSGLTPRIQGSGFHTDMGMLVNAGIPTVNFGPGDPTVAHQPDEAVALSDLHNAARAFALLIADWCGAE